MTPRPDILCIGSVLWDVIGRCDATMVAGNDKPGRIVRMPGGVALNVAATLAGLGLRPALLSALGDDAEGRALTAACARMGLETAFLTVDRARPTDTYMAIEAQGALIAAIADAHTLEAAGTAILAPLADGRLGSAAAPWTGPIALDGNLTQAVLADIAVSPLLAGADLRLAPASPGKADRLTPMAVHPRVTLYVNREEAGLLTDTAPPTAAHAAEALLTHGWTRVLVTDGDAPAALGRDGGIVVHRPPAITPRRVTGAGDTFMAAHIAAELSGTPADAAMVAALARAADFVAGAA